MGIVMARTPSANINRFIRRILSKPSDKAPAVAYCRCCIFVSREHLEDGRRKELERREAAGLCFNGRATSITRFNKYLFRCY